MDDNPKVNLNDCHRSNHRRVDAKVEPNCIHGKSDMCFICESNYNICIKNYPSVKVLKLLILMFEVCF